MITREECLEYLNKEAKRYRNAPKDVLPRYPDSKKYVAHWQRMAEIFEMAAKAVAGEKETEDD